MQRLGRHAEDLAGAVIGFAHASPQYPASADVIVRAERKPGNEVTGSGPARYVPADFAEKRQNVALQPGDLSDINAKQFVSLGADIEVGGMSRLPAPSRSTAILLLVGGQRLLFGIRARSQSIQHTFDLLFGGNDPALVLPVQFQRLPQCEQVLFAPVAAQRFLDCFPAGLDAPSGPFR
jgi:hypothetical protein